MDRLFAWETAVMSWIISWQGSLILTVLALIALAYLSCRRKKREVIPYSRANEFRPGAFMVGRDVK